MEIEGSKEDVAVISSNISNQIKQLVKPQGLDTEDIQEIETTPTLINNPIEIRKKVKRNRSTSNNAPKPSNTAIDIRFDSTKYGTPKMTWSTCNKAMWVIYTVYQETSIQELTITQIAETFNKHFKQAGAIRGSNISRDFGSKKISSPSLVGETTTNNPSTWYLTDEGNKSVQNLIAQQKNGAN